MKISNFFKLLVFVLCANQSAVHAYAEPTQASIAGFFPGNLNQACISFSRDIPREYVNTFFQNVAGQAPGCMISHPRLIEELDVTPEGNLCVTNTLYSFYVHITEEQLQQRINAANRANLLP